MLTCVRMDKTQNGVNALSRDRYASGRAAEQRVAAQLRGNGASVSVSAGSRGPADLIAQFPGKTWLVQVKSGQSPPTELTGTEKQRLNAVATRSGATPVLARVTGDGVEYRSTRSGRRLKP